LAALALSGLPTDRFAFLGFLPHKAGERRRLFAELAPLRASLVFFESPKRLVATLRELSVVLPGRAVAVARELTKLREEVLRGSAAGIADKLAARASVRGEITLVVGPPKETGAASEDEVAAAIAEALAAMPASKAASDVARRFGLSRSEIYARILALKGTAHD
jgi:16S rRNA (cytidine1402-2'-O)-methyltransferase